MKSNIYDYTKETRMYEYMKALDNKENCTLILSIEQFNDIQQAHEIYDVETGEFVKNILAERIKKQDITLLIRPFRFRKK